MSDINNNQKQSKFVQFMTKNQGQGLTNIANSLYTVGNILNKYNSNKYNNFTPAIGYVTNTQQPYAMQAQQFVNKRDIGGGISGAMGLVGNIVNSGIAKSQIKDTSGIRYSLGELAAQQYAGTNDEILEQNATTAKAGGITKDQLLNGSDKFTLGDAFESVGASVDGWNVGSKFGAEGGQLNHLPIYQEPVNKKSIGGIVGAVVGGVGSVASSIIGRAAAGRKARREAEYLTNAGIVANAANQQNFINAAEYNDDIQGRIAEFNYGNNNNGFGAIRAAGGPINSIHGTSWDNGLNYFNTGGTHEENPHQGILQGYDQQGTPNLVEEGEWRWDDKSGKWGSYIFSNRLKLPKEIAKKYKLGGNMSFAKAIKRYLKANAYDESGVLNIPSKKNTVNAFLDELATVQEEMRMQEQLNDMINQLEQLPPEQQEQALLDLQQAMQQPSQEQAMQEQQPVQEPQEETPTELPMQEQPMENTTAMESGGEPIIQQQEVLAQACGGRLRAEGGNLQEESIDEPMQEEMPSINPNEDENAEENTLDDQLDQIIQYAKETNNKELLHGARTAQRGSVEDKKAFVERANYIIQKEQEQQEQQQQAEQEKATNQLAEQNDQQQNPNEESMLNQEALQQEMSPEQMQAMQQQMAMQGQQMMANGGNLFAKGGTIDEESTNLNTELEETVLDKTITQGSSLNQNKVETKYEGTPEGIRYHQLVEKYGNSKDVEALVNGVNTDLKDLDNEELQKLYLQALQHKPKSDLTKSLATVLVNRGYVYADKNDREATKYSKDNAFIPVESLNTTQRKNFFQKVGEGIKGFFTPKSSNTDATTDETDKVQSIESILNEESQSEAPLKSIEESSEHYTNMKSLAQQLKLSDNEVFNSDNNYSNGDWEKLDEDQLYEIAARKDVKKAFKGKTISDKGRQAAIDKRVDYYKNTESPEPLTGSKNFKDLRQYVTNYDQYETTLNKYNIDPRSILTEAEYKGNFNTKDLSSILLSDDQISEEGAYNPKYKTQLNNKDLQRVLKGTFLKQDGSASEFISSDDVKSTINREYNLFKDSRTNKYKGFKSNADKVDINSLNQQGFKDFITYLERDTGNSSQNSRNQEIINILNSQFKTTGVDNKSSIYQLPEEGINLDDVLNNSEYTDANGSINQYRVNLGNNKYAYLNVDPRNYDEYKDLFTLTSDKPDVYEDSNYGTVSRYNFNLKNTEPAQYVRLQNAEGENVYVNKEDTNIVDQDLQYDNYDDVVGATTTLGNQQRRKAYTIKEGKASTDNPYSSSIYEDILPNLSKVGAALWQIYGMKPNTSMMNRAMQAANLPLDNAPQIGGQVGLYTDPNLNQEAYNRIAQTNATIQAGIDASNGNVNAARNNALIANYQLQQGLSDEYVKHNHLVNEENKARRDHNAAMTQLNANLQKETSDRNAQKQLEKAKIIDEAMGNLMQADATYRQGIGQAISSLGNISYNSNKGLEDAFLLKKLNELYNK